MKNLVLKIKSYQERHTHLTFNVPNNLSSEQVIELGTQFKQMVDSVTSPDQLAPNVIRYEDQSGIFDDRLKILVDYGQPQEPATPAPEPQEPDANDYSSPKEYAERMLAYLIWQKNPRHYGSPADVLCGTDWAAWALTGGESRTELQGFASDVYSEEQSELAADRAETRRTQFDYYTDEV